VQGIFISYRHQDSQSAAGRLADDLKERLRGVAVFRDVEAIEPGVDFVEAIERALHSCAVLLAVIGPRWLSPANAGGQRGVDDPDDYVRLEIATALRQSSVRVIPVLVEGARMPAAKELPEELHALCRRNAVELTDARWEYDVGRLTAALSKVLPASAGPPAVPVPELDLPAAGRPWYRRIGIRQWGLVAIGVAAATVMVAVSWDTTDTPPARDTDRSRLDARNRDASDATGRALTGAWQDSEGGRYRFVQLDEGNLTFDGRGPNGQAHGKGVIKGNKVVLRYNLGGVDYVARLELSPDGKTLRGDWTNPATDETGILSFDRL
jgi:hypothetical protein